MPKVPPAMRLVEVLAESYRDGELTRDELRQVLERLAPVLAGLARVAPKAWVRMALSAGVVAVEEWAAVLGSADDADPDAS